MPLGQITWQQEFTAWQVAVGVADGRVLLLDVARDCVLAQLGQHTGGVHSLAWVGLPCDAGAGRRSEGRPSEAAEGGCGAAPAGLASTGGQACPGPAETGLACPAANGRRGDAAAQADADPAGSVKAAKAGAHEANVAGGQLLLTHTAVPQSKSAPCRTLLASSGADRNVHVYEVCAVSLGAAEGPQEKGMVSAEHVCSLALPKPPAGLSEAQRGRLWVATVWAPAQCAYRERAGALEAGKGPGAASSGAGAEGKARSCMEAGEDAGAGKESVGEECLGGSVEAGGGLQLGAAASHWLITSSYGGALPGCYCSQGGCRCHLTASTETSTSQQRRCSACMECAAAPRHAPAIARAYPWRPLPRSFLHSLQRRVRHRKPGQPATLCCRAPGRASLWGWPGSGFRCQVEQHRRRRRQSQGQRQRGRPG